MYRGRVLHNIKFTWLQFDDKEDDDPDFWIDEFILIDISLTGFGNYKGENINIHQSKCKPHF